MPKKSYITSKQQAYNWGLLKLVAKEGLTANSQANRLYSLDEHENKKYVYYYLVKANNYKFEPRLFMLAEPLGFENKEPFENWQHELKGLWSLAYQREFSMMLSIKNANKYKPDLKEYQDRLNSTLLLLFNSQDINGTPSIQQAGGPIRNYQTNKIEASELKCVIAVNDMSNLVKTVFDTVIPASKVIHTLNLLPDNDLEGPDYAATLKQLLQKNELQYPFVAHMMRLATARDVLRFDFLKNTLSYEDCLANYNTKDPNVCLRRMATYGEREDIEYLYHCPVDLDINAVSAEGNSALHYAAKRGNEGIFVMKVLLLYGAKPDLKNHKGETPESIAQNHGIEIGKIANGEYEKELQNKRSAGRHKLQDAKSEEFASKNPELAKIIEDMHMQVQAQRGRCSVQ